MNHGKHGSTMKLRSHHHSKPIKTVPRSQYETVVALEKSKGIDLQLARELHGQTVQKLRDAEAHIDSLQSKSLAHTSMVRILEAKLDEREKKLAACERQQAEREERFQLVQQELASALVRAATAEACAQEAERIFAHHEAQRHGLEFSQQQNRTLQSQLTALQSSLHWAKIEHAEESSKNRALIQEMEQLQQDFNAANRSFDTVAGYANRDLTRASKQHDADAALLRIMELEVRQLERSLSEAGQTIATLQENGDSAAMTRIKHQYAIQRAEALLRSAMLRWTNRKQRNLVAYLESRLSTDNNSPTHYEAMMAQAWAALQEKDQVIAHLQDSFDSAIQDLNSDLDQVQAIRETPNGAV